jgi:hypothetical protein
VLTPASHQAVPGKAPVSLSRTELARLADVLEVLVAQHGGTVKAAALELQLPRETMGAILARPAALRVKPSTLTAIARAAQASPEQLRRGEVRLPTPAIPGAPRRPSSARVRRSTRGAR